MIWFALYNYCCICASNYQAQRIEAYPSHVVGLVIPHSFNLFWVCSDTEVSLDSAPYMYFRNPYDAVLQVDVLFGFAQFLQHNVKITFVRFYLTQFVLGSTMKEYIVTVMRRVCTVWTHQMSDHPFECHWCAFQPLRHL